MAKATQVKQFIATGWQKKAFADKSPIMLCSGAAGGGKSRLCAEKMNALMKKYPNAMGLIVRKTREAMINSIILFFEREIIGSDPEVKHVKSMRRFEYSNGSMIAYAGMRDESQREQIKSIGQKGGVDFAWIEEANKLTEGDFNEVQARMRGTAAGWQQTMLSTNPDSYMHWINQRLIIGKEAAYFVSRPEQNPAIPASYLNTLKNLTGIQRERFWLGNWKQAEGVVYSNYDFKRHVAKNWFPIPSEWRKFRAIDFGYTNPFVCQWWALSPENQLYLYREIYKTKALVEDHAKEINRLSFDETIEFTVVDWDAEDRATLARYGISNIKAFKDISLGIQGVSNRLRNNSDDKPGLIILPGVLAHPPDESMKDQHKPTCTQDEFDSYVWLRPRSETSYVPEVPLDKNNHGMDAMRYMVMALDKLSYGARVTAPSELYKGIPNSRRYLNYARL